MFPGLRERKILSLTAVKSGEYHVTGPQVQSACSERQYPEISLSVGSYLMNHK
jgi:hypothetical protein